METILPLRTELYYIRWYLLCILSLHACVFNAAWAEWGTIAQSAKAVYGWSDDEINMMINYGNIGTAVAVIPVAWLLQTRGLKSSMITSLLFTTCGLGLRCIPVHEDSITIMMSGGQILNGIGGAVTTVAPAVLSELWFPLYQRNTATCISLVFSSVGSAVAFVVGPAIIPEPFWKNRTTQNNDSIFGVSVNRSVNILENESEIERNIRFLNMTGGIRNSLVICVILLCQTSSVLSFLFKYIDKQPPRTEFAVSLLLFVLVCIKFPNKPEYPPNRTAAIKRTDFFKGLKTIIKMPSFWHITLTYAIPSGIYGIWITVLDVILHPFGISQTEAGWLSFYGNISGVIVGFILSRFSDFFLRKTRQIMILMYITAVTFFIIFLLLILGVIKSSSGMIYVFCIGGSSIVAGVMPLYYEMACECAYPVAEGTTSAVLNLIMNLSGTVFVLVTLIDGIGNMWKTWLMIASFGLTILSLFFFKIKYKRIEIDIAKDESSQINHHAPIRDTDQDNFHRNKTVDG